MDDRFHVSGVAGTGRNWRRNQAGFLILVQGLDDLVDFAYDAFIRLYERVHRMGEMVDDVERVRRGQDTGYKYFLRGRGCGPCGVPSRIGG